MVVVVANSDDDAKLKKSGDGTKLQGGYDDPQVDLPPPITDTSSLAGGFEGSDLFGATYNNDKNSPIKKKEKNAKNQENSDGIRKLEGGFDDDGVHLPPAISDTNSKIGGFEGSDLFEANYGKNNSDPLNDKNNDGLRQRNLPYDKENKPLMFAPKKKLCPVNYNPTYDEKDNARAFQTLTEFMVYILFLFIMTVTVFSYTSPKLFGQSNAMINIFVNNGTDTLPAYSSLTSYDQIWPWIENNFLDGFYLNYDLLDNDTIAPHNKILGKPRLRILKVTNESCDLIYILAAKSKTCFGRYSEGNLNKTSFGPANSPAFIYNEASELKAGGYHAETANLGGGGYVQDLPFRDRAEAYKIIQNLKNNGWVDRTTRAIFVDFAVFNSALNLHTFVKLILEVLPCGAVMPQYYIDTIKIFRYKYSFDLFICCLEGIFCGFVMFYIIKCVKMIYQQRWNYFRGWHFLDLAVIVCSIAAISLTIRLIIIANNQKTILSIGDKTKYIEMYEITTAAWIAQNATAFLCFAAWFRNFKYLFLHRSSGALLITMARASKEITAYGIMFVTFFLSYAQLGYLAFGTQVYDFSSFTYSIAALVRMLMGDMDYYALERASRIMGPIYFCTFVFLVTYILLNMFLAIINNATFITKDDISRRKKDYLVADYLENQFCKMVHKLRIHRNVTFIPPTAHFLQWKQQLKKCGYSDESIRDSCEKYDLSIRLDMDDLDEWRRCRLVERDLAVKYSKMDPMLKEVAYQRRFNARVGLLEEKIYSMDKTLNGIAKKYDSFSFEKKVKNADEKHEKKQDDLTPTEEKL